MGVEGAPGPTLFAVDVKVVAGRCDDQTGETDEPGVDVEFYSAVVLGMLQHFRERGLGSAVVPVALKPPSLVLRNGSTVINRRHHHRSWFLSRSLWSGVWLSSRPISGRTRP